MFCFFFFGGGGGGLAFGGGDGGGEGAKQECKITNESHHKNQVHNTKLLL